MYLLKHEALRPVIMDLLIRDRWKSDIPVYMDMLKNGTGEMYPIVNACISDLPDIPMREDIPKKFDRMMITFKDKNPGGYNFNTDYSGEMIELLHKIKDNSHIHVDTALFNPHLWGRHQKVSSDEPFTLSYFLHNITRCGYTENGSQLQYYVRNGNIYICSSQISSAIILDWWMQQSDAFKTDLANSSESFKTPFEFW